MKFITFAAAASLLLGSVEAYWKPQQGQSYNIMLSEEHPNFSNEKADIVEVDLTHVESVKQFHKLGKKVICYFSGGTAEDFRDDYREYFKHEGLVRDVYDEWSQERFVDYRKDSLKPILTARIKRAKEIGCDGIDVDNIDLYQIKKVKNWNNPITKNDAIRFSNWFTSTIHNYGMSVGLKNCYDMVNDVKNIFDFGISEDCANKGECQYYTNFLKSQKPVFAINYSTNYKPKVCQFQKSLPLTNVFKSKGLHQYSDAFNVNSCGSVASPLVKEEPKKTTTTTTVKKTTTKTKKPEATVNTNNNSKVNNNTGKTPKTSNAANAAKTSNAANGVNGTKSVNNANTANTANAAKTANGVNGTKSVNSANAANTANGVNGAANNAVNNTIGINSSIANGNNTVAGESTLVNVNAPVREVLPNNKKIPDENNSEEGGSAAPIVVAVTGSVVGAAAVFVFLKKNPKQYENIKRGLSRSATSVKRGATQVKRRLTTKRNPNTPSI